MNPLEPIATEAPVPPPPLAAVAPDPLRQRPVRGFYTSVGVALIVLSFILWGALPIIPFLPLETEVKIALAGTIFLVMEIVWWGGVLLAGPEVLRRMKGWFRARFRRPAEASNGEGRTP